MADGITKNGPQDRSIINLVKRREADYRTRIFGASEAALEQAVEAVGSVADAVEKFFKDHPGAR